MNIQEQFYKCSQHTAVQLHRCPSNWLLFWSFSNSHRKFHKIHVKRQMCIFYKTHPMKADTLRRKCLFFSWSVLHYWPIAAKRTSAVPNVSAVRDVQFQKISIDVNRDTPDKGLWSPRTQPLITDWSPDYQIARFWNCMRCHICI